MNRPPKKYFSLDLQTSLREKNMHNEKIIKEAEEAGIPMSDESDNKFIVLFE